MNISDEGIRLIKSYEGYCRKLANGDCTAYQSRLGNGKLDIPTIGYGCTEGVHMGMVWTMEQAEDALRREIEKHVEAVNRMVTVEINQNEADSLYSLSYNIGTGEQSTKKGFKNSKVLKYLNAGNKQKAADAFNVYIYAQGSKENGLVSRRARERALFLKPVVQPEEPYMPQTVDAAKTEITKAHVAAAATAGTATAAQFMPNVSDLDKIVSTGQRVRGLTEQAGDLGQWLMHSQATPWALLAILVGVYFIWKEAGIGQTRSMSNDSAN